MRDLLTLEQYRDELLALVRPDARVEDVPLDAAAGRVLARDVVSGVSVPVFANSAMDGYAVRFAEVAEVPVTLRVVGDVPAGSAADPAAGPGECVRIMTGAPLPSFADTVVPVEETATGTDGDGSIPSQPWDGMEPSPFRPGEPRSVTITHAPDALGRHVRAAGEDFSAGARVALAGTTITPAIAGALAAVGLTCVAVRPRPVVAVRSTGDELVTDGSPLGRGQIYESNSIALAAALAGWGADVRRFPAVGDDAAALASSLDEACVGADLVVLTGGASVGAFDVVRDVLEAAGGVFRSVRVQPGKPQGRAVWNGVPVVSLPGNPLSAALSCELFVRPLVDRMLGRPERGWLTAVAGADWTSPPGRRQLVPVRLSTGPDGRLVATPSHRRGSASHVVSSLAEADGYCSVGEDVAAVAAGDLVQVRWL
jgi:molybdopterin molybdotransferase